MLDIEEIHNTIAELENGPTTFDTCLKLASLYIVRDRFKVELSNTEPVNNVRKELSDILPHYETYCDTKRKYQLGQIGQDQVKMSIQVVCKEILEFITTLYNSTDMPEEREIIMTALDSLKLSGY